MPTKSAKLIKAAVWSSAILMTLFSIPVALAANSIVKDLTASPNPFHTQIPDKPDMAKIFFTYTWDAGGYGSGQVIEKIIDKDGNTVYYWGATEGADNKVDAVPAITEVVNLEWNGKANNGTYNGQYVPDGKYTLYISSHVDSPPDTTKTLDFNVEKTVAPALSWVSQPPANYYTGAGNYTVNYNLLLKSASEAKVRFKVKGPLNNNPQEVTVTEIKNANGNYTISWDGKINNNVAAPGQYTYTLQAEGSVDGFGVMSNELSGQVAVAGGNGPQPVLNNLTIEPNPYNPNSGDISFTYSLNGSTGNTTVMAAVYASGDTSNEIADWTFNNQSSGSNTVLWNGKAGNQTVANGSYIFKVWGSDGSFQVVPIQGSFTVTSQASSGETCAGFTDIAKNDSDCAAFTYVKSIGAMTGNPDGSFAPGEVLQRDQVAKIVLVTFDKFNGSADYCNGQNPFPDVTSNSWAFQYICRGVALGMITGYKAGADAGYYRPARAVNRVEFLALLLRNLSDSMPGNDMPSYNDVDLSQWYTGYARYSKDHDLFSGSNLFPTASTTRREVAQVIYKLNLQGKIQ